MNPTDKYEQIKDIKRLNPVELEAMVLHHEQRIKDLAAHLLELKQSTAMFKPGMSVTQGDVTPIMQFKRREWVGLTYDEINAIEFPQSGTATMRDFVRIIEAKLREKNT